MLSTRAQILDAARKLFARQGYQRTSIREIAEQLAMTKTAVLYHFPAKVDILAALTQPFVDDLATVLKHAHTREEVLNELLDVYLKHRTLLRDNVLHDLTQLAQESATHRFTDLMSDLTRKVAGPSPTLGDKVRATQAITAISEPAITHANEPTTDLRTEIQHGVDLLYPR
jgi:AcrR family transcriptional regulator